MHPGRPRPHRKWGSLRTMPLGSWRARRVGSRIAAFVPFSPFLRRAPLARLALLVPFLCPLLAAPRVVRAECTQASDNQWECVDTDSDGLDLGSSDDQVVDVRNSAAVAVEGFGRTAIQLGDDSTVNLERRAVVGSDGFDSRAIAGGHQIRLNVANRAAVVALSSDSIAVELDSGGATSGVSEIQNDGTITGSAANAVGIDINGRVDVFNRGLIDAGGTGAAAIAIAGDDSEIFNSGQIQSRAGAVAIRFADGGSGNRIVNQSDGVILATDGTAIVGGSGDETIENRGVIQGDVLLGGGDDLLLLDGGVVLGDADGGAGSDQLRISGDRVLFVDLDTVTGFETLDYSGTAGLGLFGSGSFPGGSTFRDGSVGIFESVVLAGDVQSRRSNELAFGLNEGVLTVGGQLRANGRIGFFSQGITRTGTRTLINTTGGLTGDPDFQDDSALLDLEFTRTANTLLVEIDRRSYAAPARHDQQREVGQYLDDVARAGPDAELDELMGRLDALDRNALLDAYDSLDPQFYDAQTSAALDMGREFDAVLRRPPVVCAVGEGPGAEERVWRPCETRGLEPWFLGWGSYRDRDSVGGDIGYDQAGGGLAIGVQQRLFPWLEIGVGVGAGRRTIDVDGNGSGSVTTLDFGVNAATQIDLVVIRGAASFGYGWHDTTRDVDWPGFSRRASGDFDHRRVGVSIEGAPQLDFGTLRVEPHAGFDYTWLDEDDLDETGAGTLNLDVDQRTNSLLAFETGVRLRGYLHLSRPIGEFYDFSDTILVPEVRVGYRRVLTGDDRDVDAELPSAPDGVGDFGVDAVDAEEQLIAGLGLSLQPKGGATVTMRYDLGYGDRNVAHTGALQVRIPLQSAAD